MYDAVRAYVGRTYKHQLGKVSQRDFQRFALAIGNPQNTSEDPLAAFAAGPDSIATAPPLYLSSVMVWGAGPLETELHLDGTATEQFAGLPVEGLRLMGAGQELEFRAPVMDGMDVVQETTVQDVQFKEGKSGPMILMRLQRVFRHDDRELVRCVETYIGR